MSIKVHFYLDSYLNQKGKKRIYCYVREGQKTILLNTGEEVEPDLWDNKSEKAFEHKAAQYNGTSELNISLKKFELDVLNTIRTVRNENRTASFEEIKKALNENFKKEKETFWNVYETFEDTRKIEGASSESQKKYNQLKNYLTEFQERYKFNIEFENIDFKFFDKYKIFLNKDKNLAVNTINKHITLFKSFMNWASERGYNRNKLYKQFKTKGEKTKIIFLSENELYSIYNLDLNNNPKLARVRDSFVFQCLTGVRYSDLKNLDQNDIKGNVWELRTKKTNEPIKIPLNKDAKNILLKYKKSLPVPSNQKMNSYLKEICEKAKINEPVKVTRTKGNKQVSETKPKHKLIGTHTARRTFVSLSLQNGMRAETVMKITGHTTYKMMQKYLEVTDQSLTSEMQDAWGMFFKRRN